MNIAAIIGEIMEAAIPLIVIVGGFALLALKIMKGSSSRANSAEETKMMQDIYVGLQRMEERVEALETLLLEKDRKG